MKSFEAVELFAAQLKRAINGTKFKTKVVVTPSSVDEKGLVIKVSILKTILNRSVPAAKKTRTVRLRVAVTGSAESQTGLDQALECIELLDEYLESEGLRLEQIVTAENTMESYIKMPGTRIVQHISDEDSFFDSPDSTAVQDVEDVRIVEITIPTGENDG